MLNHLKFYFSLGISLNRLCYFTKSFAVTCDESHITHLVEVDLCAPPHADNSTLSLIRVVHNMIF